MGVARKRVARGSAKTPRTADLDNGREWRQPGEPRISAMIAPRFDTQWRQSSRWESTARFSSGVEPVFRTAHALARPRGSPWAREWSPTDRAGAMQPCSAWSRCYKAYIPHRAAAPAPSSGSVQRGLSAAMQRLQLRPPSSRRLINAIR